MPASRGGQQKRPGANAATPIVAACCAALPSTRASCRLAYSIRFVRSINMSDANDKRRRLEESLRGLSPSQIDSIHSVVRALSSPIQNWASSSSSFATNQFVVAFGDILRLHHYFFSDEPFTKDKFEHAMVRVLRALGHEASLARRGNRGHDMTVDGERWSLKTQADEGIKADELYISKFMELGRGKWVDERDLIGLRDSMLKHMEGYDRIFSLRCLSRSRNYEHRDTYEYELVEIPKALLELSRSGMIEMRHESRQNPKPGYCTVTSEGVVVCRLYFDGGTERKLQIKSILKTKCLVHATWRFTIPESP